MIADTITKKIGEALKAKDEVRLSTLRMLSSALNYEKIAKQHDLGDEEEIVVVRKEAKKRMEAVEAYERAGAIDRVDREKSEYAILKEFLPAEMGEEELTTLVELVIKETDANSARDMGKVIGAVVLRAGGRADGSKVSAIVKQKLL